MGRRPVPPQGLQVAHWPGSLTLGLTRWAQAAYKPPTVVFLGDLMDEASEADTDQMDRSLPKSHAHITLPSPVTPSGSTQSTALGRAR